MSLSRVQVAGALHCRPVTPPPASPEPIHQPRSHISSLIYPDAAGDLPATAAAISRPHGERIIRPRTHPGWSQSRSTYEIIGLCICASDCCCCRCCSDYHRGWGCPRCALDAVIKSGWRRQRHTFLEQHLLSSVSTGTDTVGAAPRNEQQLTASRTNCWQHCRRLRIWILWIFNIPEIPQFLANFKMPTNFNLFKSSDAKWLHFKGFRAILV